MEKRTKKNGLPIIAGVLLLLVFLLDAARIFLMGQPQTKVPASTLLTMILPLLIAAAVFLGRKDDLVPIALGLSLLNSLRFILNVLMSLWYHSFMSLPPVLPIISTLLLFLLALPQTREKLRSFWFCPALIEGIWVMKESISLGDHISGMTATLYFFMLVAQVYAYIMLGLWLKGAEMSAKNMFCLNVLNIECSTGEMVLNLLVKANLLVLAIIVGARIAGIREGNEFLIPFLMLFCPFVLAPVLIFSIASIATRTDRKRMKHEHNVMMAILGHDEGLRKERAKAARNKVIKSAVIGSVIAGDTGAVVGAVAEKAKQDAESGASGTADPKAVTKGAVIGGIVAGEAGAIVGAAAVKAGENAKQKKQ